MKNTLTLILLFLCGCFWTATVHAQEERPVLKNQAVMNFPDGIRFELTVNNKVPIQSVDLVYRISGRSCQQQEFRQSLAISTENNHKLEWFWDWERSGILPPGTQVEWNWEILDQEGNFYQTQPANLQVIDQRYAWKTIETDKIVLSWIKGNEQFGNSLFELVQSSLQKLQEELTIRPEGTIYVTVYPSADDLRASLQWSNEWVGGVAFPRYNSTMIAVGPEELAWASQLIPHELTHLAIEVLTFNCRGGQLPSWLEEGLAEYIEEPNSAAETKSIQAALASESLAPLKSLEGSFSAYGSEAQRSYEQSKLVVNYLIKNYGKDKLPALLSLVQKGMKIDTALEEIYGFDTNQLDAEWRLSLGFIATPVPAGSHSSPTIVPTLELVNPIINPTGTAEPATPTPTKTIQPEPSISPVPPTHTATPGFQEAGISRSTGITAVLIISAVMVTAVYSFMRWRQSHPPS